MPMLIFSSIAYPGSSLVLMLVPGINHRCIFGLVTSPVTFGGTQAQPRSGPASENRTQTPVLQASISPTINHPQPKNLPAVLRQDVLVSPFRQDTSADFQGRPPCYPRLSSLCRGSPFAAVHCMATVPKSIICQATSDWLKIPILANQRRQGAPLIKSFECPGGSNIPVALRLTDSAMDEWWNQAVLCSLRSTKSHFSRCRGH